MTDEAKAAKKAYHKEWRARNKDRIREYNRRFWEKRAGNNIENKPLIKDKQIKDEREHLIDYNGESHSISEWSKILGIKRSTLSARLRYGWSIEEAFSKGKVIP